MTGCLRTHRTNRANANGKFTLTLTDSAIWQGYNSGMTRSTHMAPPGKTNPQPQTGWVTRAILTLLLAVASGSARAEWLALGTNDNGATTVYADSSAIARSGHTAKMWSLIDFKQAAQLSDGKKFLSWKTQYEFNCQTRQSRMLAASMHSANMGGGEITNSLDFESSQWEAVPSESNGEVLWNYACHNGFQNEQAAQRHCPNDTVIWLNSATGMIHHRGQHWYGRTKAGTYVCEKEAAQIKQQD